MGGERAGGLLQASTVQSRIVQYSVCACACGAVGGREWAYRACGVWGGMWLVVARLGCVCGGGGGPGLPPTQHAPRATPAARQPSPHHTTQHHPTPPSTTAPNTTPLACPPCPQAIYVPADDLTDPAPATTFAHLDATTVLSRGIAGALGVGGVCGGAWCVGGCACGCGCGVVHVGRVQGGQLVWCGVVVTERVPCRWGQPRPLLRATGRHAGLPGRTSVCAWCALGVGSLASAARLPGIGPPPACLRLWWWRSGHGHGSCSSRRRLRQRGCCNDATPMPAALPLPPTGAPHRGATSAGGASRAMPSLQTRVGSCHSPGLGAEASGVVWVVGVGVGGVLGLRQPPLVRRLRPSRAPPSAGRSRVGGRGGPGPAPYPPHGAGRREWSVPGGGGGTGSGGTRRCRRYQAMPAAAG